jgi:hypothetical protein
MLLDRRSLRTGSTSNAGAERSTAVSADGVEVVDDPRDEGYVLEVSGARTRKAGSPETAEETEEAIVSAKIADREEFVDWRLGWNNYRALLAFYLCARLKIY